MFTNEQVTTMLNTLFNEDLATLERYFVEPHGDNPRSRTCKRKASVVLDASGWQPQGAA